ncbi:MAG: AarF/ABC1/UbiB kinase family protein [Parasporobacterium sp.]|nr:AarF/ABC1/UbiB kinase family protein [Parasporobacterium sp.]
MAGKKDNKAIETTPEEMVSVENVSAENVSEETAPEENMQEENTPVESAAEEIVSDEIVPEESAPTEDAPAEKVPIKKKIEKKIEDKKAAAAGKVTKNKEELQKELDARKKKLLHSKVEFSDKLKTLLSEDIAKFNKKEKKRSAEIMGVFAKHNFYANGFTPEELRTTLEDLGPTYVKIGQIMSSRVDMLPESYCQELTKLRQNVKELDPEIAKAVIEQETGKKIDEIFREFRDKPLGSASIGQAHYGVLKDGTQVVTKVQRPLIAEMMRKDFVLLKKLSKTLDLVAETDEDGETEKMVDLYEVIDELEKVTEEELDFRVEAENTRFFKENCIEDEEKISCPSVIDELTTERIFTMTYVDGYSISKRERFIEDGYDVDEVGTIIVDNYLHQVLDVGTFHADPHQGNIMISKGKPVWIDFGMIGRVTENDINTIQTLILSLIDMDLDGLVNGICALGAASPKTNRAKLIEDAEILMNKYMSVTNLDELDTSALLEEIMDIASKHHISLPGKLTMLVRSVATIEGVLEEFCPKLNLFTLLTDRFMERAKKNFNLKAELTAGGKEALAMGKKAIKIPVLASDALNTFVKGRTKMTLEVTGYDELLKKGAKTIKTLVLAIFACILFIGSCILCTADVEPKTANGMPLIAGLGLVVSVGLGIYVIKKLSKKK